MSELNLEDGTYEIPAGKLVSIVTSLEMTERPDGTALPLPAGYRLDPLNAADLVAYRELYRSIGEDWFWFSRSLMSDNDLTKILSHHDVTPFALKKDGANVGILELDFRVPGDCELMFFGLQASEMGKGLGKVMMSHAIELAWSREISRFWLHTCTFDSPSALGFYLRAGFVPYRRQIEIHDDFRLSGELAQTAAPHVPLLKD